MMKKMALAAGLDITKKNFTNHSVRKTTVNKLRKRGATSREIIAITGQKSEQSLVNYDTLDHDDHRHLGSILSAHGQTKHSAIPHVIPPPSFCSPSTSSASMVFNNCTVYFGESSTACNYSQSLSNTHLAQQPQVRSYRKRALISSDTDSD